MSALLYGLRVALFALALLPAVLVVSVWDLITQRGDGAPWTF